MKDLAQRARDRKLKPEEFQGGTFSISNLGMFGIKSFASILNEPQGAILSVGAGEKRAVVRAGALAIATVMTVTLTCDHRVLNGTIGAAWLNAFKALVEDPLMMLA
jgi:pyruvate dehydrogenase E2 component (dihydrolipoamide acetyltransferase)